MLSSKSSFILRKLVASTPSRNIAASIGGSRYSASTLVICDPLTDAGETPAPTQSAVTAANQLGQNVDLLVVSSTTPTKVPEGVTNVYHVNCDDRLAETVATSAQTVATSKDCNIVVGTSSKFGSTVVPRAAALLDCSPITDILEIHDSGKFICAIFRTKFLRDTRSNIEKLIFVIFLFSFLRYVCSTCK